MTLEERREVFRKFLYENNCYDEYTVAVDTSLKSKGLSDEEVNECVNTALKSEFPDSLFSVELFSWVRTPQGHNYWKDIYFKWKKKF